MATRTPSSRLCSQLLLATKTPSVRTRPCASIKLTKPTSPRAQLFTTTTRRHLSSSTCLFQRENNTAPAPPSQSATNTSASTSTSSTSSTTPHKKYTFTELSTLLCPSGSQSPSSHPIILIDVREPSELASTGRIPTSINLPLKSSPDFPFLSAEEFEDRFGRARPSGKDEVIFYCRSGVRSKAAVELARQAGFGGTVSEFPGSWLEWEAKGGKVER